MELTRGRGRRGLTEFHREDSWNQQISLIPRWIFPPPSSSHGVFLLFLFPFLPKFRLSPPSPAIPGGCLPKFCGIRGFSPKFCGIRGLQRSHGAGGESNSRIVASHLAEGNTKLKPLKICVLAPFPPFPLHSPSSARSFPKDREIK